MARNSRPRASGAGRAPIGDARRDVEARVIGRRLPAVDALRAKQARDAPLDRPDELLPPAVAGAVALARGLDAGEFWPAQRHEGFGRPARRARDVEPLDPPFARRHRDRAGDRAPVCQRRAKRRDRSGVTVEGGEEASLGVEHQRRFVEPRADGAGRGLPADPAALGRLAGVSEDGGRRLRGLRGRIDGRHRGTFGGRGRTTAHRQQADGGGPQPPHARSFSRRVAISGLA